MELEFVGKFERQFMWLLVKDRFRKHEFVGSGAGESHVPEMQSNVPPGY